MNLFAYGAGRHMAHKNLDQSELTDPVQNLFSVSSELYDVEDLLVKLDHQNRQDEGSGPASRQLLAVKRLLADLLPDFDDPSCIEIHSARPLASPPVPGSVVIQMPTGSVPFSGLSLGYKTMTAWAVDLALRLFQTYSDSESPLEEPAVVLVDEIDLHLHPSWQRTVKENLTKDFPNTQFICTAHSPLMAQAAEDANLEVLKLTDGEARIESEPESISGWRIDQILTSDLFDLSSSRSAKVQRRIDERRALLDSKTDRSKDKERLRELDEELSMLRIAEEKSDQEAIELIRKFASEIRMSDGTK